jgi:hypothetical protein
MYLHLDISVILRYAEKKFLVGRSFRQEYQFRILFFLLKTQHMAMQEMANTNGHQE